MDGVELPLRQRDELHRRGSIRLGQRVDPQTLTEVPGRRIGQAVDEQTTHDQPVHSRRRPRHEVSVRNRAVVSGGQDQVLATGAAIRTRAAHVGDEPEPRVVDGGRAATGWDLDHGGAVPLEIEDARDVHGVGVAGQEQRGRIQQSVQDADLVAGRHADLLHADPHRLERSGRHTAEEHLDSAEEVQVVEEELRGRLGGETIGELECADTGVDPVRCQDLRRHRRVVALRCHAVAHQSSPLVVPAHVVDLLPPASLGSAVGRHLI